ncbi:MAG: NHL repeat-containing protein [Nocardioides sp.]
MRSTRPTGSFDRPRRASVALSIGALVASLLAPIVLATTPSAASAPAAAPEPPAFLGTLAGPSLGAMYPSGEQYDAVHDRLIVADTGRDRVLIYSLTGAKLDEFGAYGDGDGQFASPRDVAVDDDGNIYVADAENNRIQAFDPDGVFRWKAGGLAQGAETLNTPIGVTWDSVNEVLLVASTGQSLIKAYSPTGTRLWTSPTGNELGAHAMRDVQRGPDGRLWITAYREHQIRVYDVSADGLTWDTTPAFVLGDGAINGSGDGQLNFPYNVAWSPDGETAYVSDTGNGRVARWDISGPAPVWLPPFGGRCDNHPQPCADPPVDAGRFNHLRRVTVDSAGLVYGADFWGAGIEVFDPDDGSSVRSIEGAEPPVPGFSEAYAVDVAPDGHVYVMDRLNHRVQRFTAAGDYVTKVGARGTQPATFSWPEGLTVAPNGRVWALDTRGGRIESFPADLATRPTIQSYGSSGDGGDELNYPSNADVADDGVVWIADTRNDRLMRFDPATETFLAPIGGPGSAAGQLQDPMGVAVTDDVIYVADTGNDRIQKLTLAGAPLATFGTGLAGPQGLEVAPDGSVWVTDTGNSRLVHLSDDLVDIGDGFGSIGTGDHQFFDPHDLAFGNNKMYVADTYNNRVQVFEEPPTTEPPPPPPPPPGDRWVYDHQISDPGGRASIYPAGVAIADADTWYVADSAGSRLVSMDPGTGAVSPIATPELKDPRDVVLDSVAADSLWVLSTGANRVLRLSTSGANLGSPITGLSQPYGLDQDDTHVYVANTYGGEVRAYAKSDTSASTWTQDACDGVGFSRPRDVGVTDDGRILVADTDNDRIVLLDAGTGACDDSFGSRGSGPAQFKSPRTVTADGAGGLWVGDAFNYRIQHLSLAGTPLGATPVDAYGSADTQFVSPHCVTAVPATDDVAVCDTFNNRITIWDGSPATPTLSETVAGVRPAPGGFNGPFGLGYGPSGELYVADWFNHRVQKFNADGSFAWQRGSYGPRDGSMIFPRNVLVSGDEVFVTDSENNRIDVFSPDGDFIRKIRGEDGALSRPHQIALDGSGGFWVADTNKDRVVHLDASGRELLVIPITGAVARSRPQGIAVDTDGTVLVSNSGNDRVERYSVSGALLETVLGPGTTPSVDAPAGLQVTGSGTDRLTWVTDLGQDRVIALDASGDVVQLLGASGPGRLLQPRSVALDPSDGDVAVADFGNDRVAVWTEQDVAPGCSTREASYGASLKNGPQVLRFALVGVELCSDGDTVTVERPGEATAATTAPPRVTKAMAGIGMGLRYDGGSEPRETRTGSGAAGVRVSGSWSSCLDWTYRSAVLERGIKQARAKASGATRSRLGSWSSRRIVTSSKIPVGVKRRIAELGVTATLRESSVTRGRATLRRLAHDVVGHAFAGAPRRGLKRIVRGSCVTKVWAPRITITMTAAGSVTDAVSGRARRWDVDRD